MKESCMNKNFILLSLLISSILVFCSCNNTTDHTYPLGPNTDDNLKYGNMKVDITGFVEFEFNSNQVSAMVNFSDSTITIIGTDDINNYSIMIDIGEINIDNYIIGNSYVLKPGEASATVLCENAKDIYWSTSGELTISKLSPTIEGTFSFSADGLLNSETIVFNEGTFCAFRMEIMI